MVDAASLRPGQESLVRPLPRNWLISFNVRFDGPRDALKVGLGSSVVTIFDGGRDWHHARLTERVLSVDGHKSKLTATGATTASLRATGGEAQIRALRITQR